MVECTICFDLLSNPAEDRCVHQLRFSRPLMRQRTAFMRSCSLNDLSYTPCGHEFHTRCLQNWLMTSDNPTCPNCRAKTSFQKIKQISPSFVGSGETGLNCVETPISEDTSKMVKTQNVTFSPHRRQSRSSSTHRQGHRWSPFLDIILASLRAHVQSDD